MESRQPDAVRIAIAVIGLLSFGALALTESFAELPAALVGYGAAWWVLRLGQDTPTGPGETRWYG